MYTIVKFKKLDAKAIPPTYSTKEAAGADLHLCCDESITINPHQTILVSTKLSIEMCQGIVGLVFARSGLATKKGIAPANKVGVIDSDYRGEIMVPLHNHSNEPQTFVHGDRIAQIIFMPHLVANFIEEDNLSHSIRGEAGFGSTGI